MLKAMPYSISSMAIVTGMEVIGRIGSCCCDVIVVALVLVPGSSCNNNNVMRRVFKIRFIVSFVLSLVFL